MSAEQLTPEIALDCLSRWERREQLRGKTLGDALGFELQILRKDCVAFSMPADERTFQPWKIVHGGANVALAETCASIGAWLNIDDDEKFMVVGVEINANHIRPVRSGRVLGIGTPIHIGRSTQVWEVRLTDSDGKLTCISRCTLAVVPRR